MLIGDRDFHHQQKYCSQLQFFQQLQKGQLRLQSKNAEELGTPWDFRAGVKARIKTKVFGTGIMLYQKKREEDWAIKEQDLYSPGYLSVVLESGDTVTIEAQLGFCDKSNIALNCAKLQPRSISRRKRLSEIFAWKGDRRIGGWGNDLDQS